MKKILIISEEGILGDTGTSYLLKNTFKSLNNHEINSFECNVLKSNENIYSIEKHIFKFLNKSHINNIRKNVYTKEGILNLNILKLFITRLIIGDSSNPTLLINYGKIRQKYKNISPDIIYTPLGSIAVLQLVEKLMKEFRVPIIVHIMDDWISAKNTHGVIGILNGAITRYYFNKIIKYATVRIVISEYMKNAYELRYGYSFKVIANTPHYQPAIESEIERNEKTDQYKIVYVGTFSADSQQEGILDLIEVVKNSNYYSKIRFDIYVNASSMEYAKKIISNQSQNVSLFLAPSSDIEFSGILLNANLLFLPSSFAVDYKNYIRYSMPAKFPIYLISGTPILIYGNRNSAQVDIAIKNCHQLVIGSRSINTLNAFLTELIEEKFDLKKIVKIQKNMYYKYFDPIKMREEFIKILESVSMHNIIK